MSRMITSTKRSLPAMARSDDRPQATSNPAITVVPTTRCRRDIGPSYHPTRTAGSDDRHMVCHGHHTFNPPSLTTAFGPAAIPCRGRRPGEVVMSQRARILVAFAAVVLIVAPGMAIAGTAGGNNDADQ